MTRRVPKWLKWSSKSSVASKPPFTLAWTPPLITTPRSAPSPTRFTSRLITGHLSSQSGTRPPTHCGLNSQAIILIISVINTRLTSPFRACNTRLPDMSVALPVYRRYRLTSLTTKASPSRRHPLLLSTPLLLLFHLPLPPLLPLPLCGAGRKSVCSSRFTSGTWPGFSAPLPRSPQPPSPFLSASALAPNAHPYGFRPSTSPWSR